MHAWFIRAIRRASMAVGGISVCAMAAVIFAEVILRSFLGSSLRVSEDIASYCLGYAIFWGALMAIDSEKFIRVDVLFGRFSQKGKDIINILNDFLFLLFLLLASYYFTLAQLSAFRMNTLTNTFYRWPIFYIKLPLMIGLYLLVVYLAYRLIYRVYEQISSRPDVFEQYEGEGK
ncbi:membrane hypothetical protein [uncultured delta proteobacterium]|uniref:Tripartite ATP-independent periplasmic transporters DctQ component domain-containing protein n=1 Tax=uncultured delta proteobacterium TaxID=34034 RepID=A0A212K2U6_9DELT|nr:membrane hypothetical protein [uncultured delta proteobacterium]